MDYRTGEALHPLFLRRAGGGVIYSKTLALAEEFRLLQVAWAHGVKVPEPLHYFPDLEGREAFLMRRLEGETIGARVVRRPELARARETLPQAMAEELAKIHALSPDEVPFLQPPSLPSWRAALEEAYRDLDALGEPHPALEWGLRWLLDHPPRELPPWWSTATSAWATSWWTGKVWWPFWTGSSPTWAIRGRIWPGPWCGPGALGRTGSAWGVWGRWGLSWNGTTPSRAGTSPRRSFSGGRSWGTCAGGLGP